MLNLLGSSYMCIGSNSVTNATLTPISGSIRRRENI